VTPFVDRNYFSPVPGAPDWDVIATVQDRPGGEAFYATPEPLVRNAPAGNPAPATGTNGSRGAQGHPALISDATPDNDWIPNAQYAGDGHHHAPRAVYEKLALPDETRRVFDKGTTGPLPWYRRHQNDALHRAYSNAVDELMKRFMARHNIKPEQMTPDQARSVLKEIAESEEPRIRVYREMIKCMWMFYRLRSGGRGSE
jgi:hypothetical protein